MAPKALDRPEVPDWTQNQGVSHRALAVGAETAAAMLSISATTLRVMSREGKIPSRRIGGRRVYVVSELEAWLSSQPGDGQASIGA